MTRLKADNYYKKELHLRLARVLDPILIIMKMVYKQNGLSKKTSPKTKPSKTNNHNPPAHSPLKELIHQAPKTILKNLLSNTVQKGSVERHVRVASNNFLKNMYNSRTNQGILRGIQVLKLLEVGEKNATNDADDASKITRIQSNSLFREQPYDYS